MGRQSKYPHKKSVIVETVLKHEDSHGKVPSVRELAKIAGVSTATLHSYLTRLSEEGLIEWRPKHHRSLMVTEKGRRLSQASTKVPF